MSEVSNEKLLKFVNTMDDLVELGEELMKDGKIDLGDITSLPKAASVVSELVEVGKQYKEMLVELKDLDKEELKQLIDAAID
jgi:hypothetical protein